MFRGPFATFQQHVFAAEDGVWHSRLPTANVSLCTDDRQGAKDEILVKDAKI
jgi:hypothetical protein